MLIKIGTPVKAYTMTNISKHEYHTFYGYADGYDSDNFDLIRVKVCSIDKEPTIETKDNYIATLEFKAKDVKEYNFL